MLLRTPQCTGRTPEQRIPHPACHGAEAEKPGGRAGAVRRGPWGGGRALAEYEAVSHRGAASVPLCRRGPQRSHPSTVAGGEQELVSVPSHQPLAGLSLEGTFPGTWASGSLGTGR